LASLCGHPQDEPDVVNNGTIRQGRGGWPMTEVSRKSCIVLVNVTVASVAEASTGPKRLMQSKRMELPTVQLPGRGAS
jgi:hypothetical protein